MKTASSISAMLLAASTLLACGGQGQTPGQTNAQPAAGTQKTGEVIATIGTGAITVDEFRVKMEEQSPFIRARYTTLERKKEFLDNMVRFEVLAQEAERRGFQNDPDVVATMKKVMVQKLMRAEFDEKAEVQEIPEAELRAFYDANAGDYVKPERVRASHIFLASPRGDANRNKVKSEAARLLAEVKSKETGPIKTGFADAAKVRSDDAPSKVAGGDLLFKTRDELAQAWGEGFADALFKMKTIGDIGGLVETDKGIHLVKLTGRQNALDRSFESVKAQIQSRLFREKRTKTFDDFVAELKVKANVQVKDDVLAGIEVVPAGLDGLGNDAAAAGQMLKPAMAPPALPVPAKAEGAIDESKPRTLQGPGGRTLTIPAGGLKIPNLPKLPPPTKAEN